MEGSRVPEGILVREKRRASFPPGLVIGNITVTGKTPFSILDLSFLDYPLVISCSTSFPSEQ